MFVGLGCSLWLSRLCAHAPKPPVSDQHRVEAPEMFPTATGSLETQVNGREPGVEAEAVHGIGGDPE